MPPRYRKSCPLKVSVRKPCAHSHVWDKLGDVLGELEPGFDVGRVFAHALLVEPDQGVNLFLCLDYSIYTRKRLATARAPRRGRRPRCRGASGPRTPDGWRCMFPLPSADV